MGLRIAASMLTLLCSWVLWEKHMTTAGINKITAVQEAGTLLDCQQAIPNMIKQAEAKFQKHHKQPEHTLSFEDRDLDG